MKLTTFFVGIAGLLLASNASALTVTIASTATGNRFTISTPAATSKLTSVATYKVGWFGTTPASDVDLKSPGLAADFHEFANSTTGFIPGRNKPSEPDRIGSAILTPMGAAVDTVATFVSKKIYLWVTDSTGQYGGIFSSNTTTPAANYNTWFFAGSNTPPADAVLLQLDDANEAFGKGASVGATTANSLVLGALNPIPEPASVAMLAAGLGMFLRRKRK